MLLRCRCSFNRPRLSAGHIPGRGGVWTRCVAHSNFSELSHASRLPRFYVPPPLPAAPGGNVSLTGQEAQHALRSLRLRVGDMLELCDGKGFLAPSEIVHVDKRSATLKTTAARLYEPWQGPEWTLVVACTTIKGGRADWLVEKAVELGAHALLPIVTERSSAGGRNKFKTTEGAVEGDFDGSEGGRLERLAVAATKQSLRAHMMRLMPPAHIKEATDMIQHSQIALVAAAGAPPLRRVLNDVEQQGRLEPGAANTKRLLFIGPEGDFTPGEMQQLLASGALPVGLGPHRLRTETAALALLAAATLYDAS